MVNKNNGKDYPCRYFYRLTVTLKFLLYGYCFGRRLGLLAGFLFGVYVRGKIYEECTEHDRGDVKCRADVPAEFFGNILEDCERGIAGTYEKHIDGSAGNVTEDQVDRECDTAKHEKSDDGVQIILLCFCKPSGYDQINTDEDQQHMPEICVKRERPIAMRDARRLDECHNAAEQIVRGHKSVDSVAQGTGLQKKRNDTQIHGHAAKLEGKYPPYIRIITHIKVIEKLLIDFGQNEKSSDTSQNGFVTSFRKIAELPGEENANGYADKRE